MSEIECSKTRVKGFSDPEMDFQLIRQLGSSSYGGASVGECLSTAARIKDGDPLKLGDSICNARGAPGKRCIKTRCGWPFHQRE